jgi:hypothetical protein
VFWECEVAPSAVPRPNSNAWRRPRRAFFVAGLLILVLLLPAGCGRSQSALTETKDDYQVTFATDPAPPAQGAGMIIIGIKDKQGQAVENVPVSVEANMNHAGMKPESANSANGVNGEYHLPINWTMSGSWYVDVKISLPSGELIRRQFPVDVK